MNWFSVKEKLPDNENTVLAVKELKSGRREICLAYCIKGYEQIYMDSLSCGLGLAVIPHIVKKRTEKAHWVTNGSSNILYWMPLPEMPEG